MVWKPTVLGSGGGTGDSPAAESSLSSKLTVVLRTDFATLARVPSDADAEAGAVLEGPEEALEGANFVEDVPMGGDTCFARGVKEFITKQTQRKLIAQTIRRARDNFGGGREAVVTERAVQCEPFGLDAFGLFQALHSC